MLITLSIPKLLLVGQHKHLIGADHQQVKTSVVPVEIENEEKENEEKENEEKEEKVGETIKKYEWMTC